MQLQVHLQNEQCITFDTDNPNALQQITTNPNDTHLTGFFKANRRFEAAQQFLYIDFPTYFTWD